MTSKILHTISSVAWFKSTLVIFAVVATLAACGGGGGGSSADAPPAGSTPGDPGSPGNPGVPGQPGNSVKGWQGAVAIAGSGEAIRHRVAIDAGGNIVMVWQQSDGVFLAGYDVWGSRFVPGTGWSAPTKLESGAGSTDQPELAIDPVSGHAVAVWTQQSSAGPYVVWASQYTPAGGWAQAVQLPTTERSAHARVGIDASGNAMAVWTQLPATGRASIVASRFTAGQGWAAPVRVGIALGNGEFEGFPSIAMSPAGDAGVIWTNTFTIPVKTSVWANRFTPGGGWETAQQVDTGAGNNGIASGSPGVAIDDSGNIVTAWRQSDNSIATYSTWSRSYVPGSGWGTRFKVSDEARFDTSEPARVAVNAAGSVTVVWTEGNAAAPKSIWANRGLVTGGWGTPVQFVADPVASPGAASAAQVAMDAEGNAISVWQQNESGNSGVSHVWGNRYSASAGWAGPQRLESVLASTSLNPQLAMNSAGNAIAVWQQSTDSEINVWTNLYLK